MLCFDWNVMII